MQVRNFTNSSELNSCELSSDCIKPAQVLPKFVAKVFFTIGEGIFHILWKIPCHILWQNSWVGLIQSYESSQEFNSLKFVKFRT